MLSSQGEGLMATAGEVKEERRARVLKAMGDMIGPEDRQKFFELPHPLFSNKRPEDMLESEEETQLLVDAFEGLASGSYQ